jgi:hypothetical protein
MILKKTQIVDIFQNAFNGSKKVSFNDVSNIITDIKFTLNNQLALAELVSEAPRKR